MKILIINGPNINMLGYRNYEIYGDLTYKKLKNKIQKYDKDIVFFQSNSECKIINKIQKLKYKENKYDGIIVNIAAYTHTSIAIRDALEILDIRKVEVHLSNIYNREEFRKKNFISDVVDISFYGEQVFSYIKAIDWIREVNNE